MPREHHPNWVTFDTVNALRFPYNPVPDTKWTRWCRNGKVPCCKFPDGWRIDLTRFDAQFSVEDEPTDDERRFVASLNARLNA